MRDGSSNAIDNTDVEEIERLPFIPSWDAMGALDRWVTDGAAPGVLVGTDTNRATLGRSRPLCPYPTYPRYGGSGSIDNASNYACAAP